MNDSPKIHASDGRVLFVVYGITLLTTMGISSLIPCLPLLAETFHIAPEHSWGIIAAFAMPGFLFIPPAGVWADRYGRRNVLLPSLLLFALGGAGCMFASTYTELLICRAVQGAGSAPLGLLYSTIIADVWQGERRARIMGYTGMALGLGTALSPAAGGALAMLDWRLPFALPLLALPLAWAARDLPLTAPAAPVTLRAYLGSVYRCASGRQTLTLLGLTLLTFTILSGPIITCFPVFAEKAFTATSLDIGIIIAAASLASGLAASQLGRLYRRFSTRSLFFASVLFYIAALCSMPAAPGLWWLIPPVALFGLGQGLNIPLVTTLLTEQAPDEQRAALMAANAILRRLAQNLGPAIFGTLAVLTGSAKAIAAGSLLAVAMALLAAKTPLPPMLGYMHREKGQKEPL